ncbi:putative plastid-lipid-associated chloroplastic [Micractinium conductrix]|uniref:Plastid-lipid-associated chloroplastic n=1 Tax=Micractinium conductrix TaxID=554055 RepID=A0A2P6V1N2_9CHLO|nr:putative plastid-lipid-associated chloroplastic [Micractinium conductrix]|eukprot:PSC67954.1 putative plastid-lipid-associated chloroplastic [Micractinium conductrix]
MLSSASQTIASRAPLAAPARRPASAARGRAPLRTQALFSFLSPPKAKAGPGKAQELVDRLLELTERTNGGLNASPAKRDEIAGLVDELEGYCPRAPMRSPLIFGDYEVLYASKPQSAGGPFRSPLGQAVFPGQRARQLIQEPNVCINEVTFKTLGFIPGKVRQEGEIKAIDNNTFQIIFPALVGKAMGGPPQRIIQIAYLDDRIRVARAIPSEDREDQSPSFYVFRRLGVEAEAQEEEEAPAPPPKRSPFGTRKIKAAAQEEEQAPAPKRAPFGTQLMGRKEGLATMAERRYAQQQSGSRGTGPAGGTGTTARKTREEVAAERAAERAAAEEERQAAREAAAAAKAAAEEERRAKQAQLEAERQRAAEVKEAAKAQLAELQAEAAQAMDAAKEAIASVKEAEKAAAELLKLAAGARAAIDQAAGAAAAAAQQADGFKGEEKAAAAAVGEARAVVKQLETAARRK